MAYLEADALISHACTKSNFIRTNKIKASA